MPEKRLQRARDSYTTNRCWFCKQPVVPKPGKPWPKYDLKYDMWMCSPEHAPSGVSDCPYCRRPRNVCQGDDECADSYWANEGYLEHGRY